MRKLILSLLAISASICNVSAQRELKNPLVNSAEVIKTGYKLYETEKFKEAIAEYSKVPVSDTNYSIILHELVLTYYRDSNFAAAKNISRTASHYFRIKSKTGMASWLISMMMRIKANWL